MRIPENGASATTTNQTTAQDASKNFTICAHETSPHDFLHAGFTRLQAIWGPLGSHVKLFKSVQKLHRFSSGITRVFRTVIQGSGFRLFMVVHFLEPFV